MALTLLKKGHIQLNQLAKDEVETCHIRFCRFALGVSKKAPNIGIYGETGRYPLAIESILNTIKYWHRLQNIHESTLVHQAFNEMKHSNLENSWFATVQSLLTRSNIKHDMAVKQVIKSIKTELQGQFLSFWKKKLFDDTNKAGGNKLRSYRTYKNTFQQEEYLTLKSKAQRGDFSRLRLSAHKLQIEIGRYMKKGERKDPQDRLCAHCSTKKCEDEFHFIMKCPLYEDLRKELFTSVSHKFPIFNEYDESQQFIWLMSTLDMDIINTFTTYVHTCFVKRRNVRV